jgi:hypothetical protein
VARAGGFSKLVATLNYEIQGLRHTKHKGLLWRALKLVGEWQGKDVDPIVRELGLTGVDDLYRDNEVLDRLALPPVAAWSKPVPFIGTDSLSVDRATSPLLIMAATTILEFWPAAPKTEAWEAELPQEHGPTGQRYAVALVLKGKDIANFETGKQIGLAEVNELVEKAGYFAFASDDKMDSIVDQLSLVDEQFDPTSEEQVLVRISFSHHGISNNRHVENKIELGQYLRRDADDWTIVAIRPLLKTSGLGRAGFIRS